MLDATPPQATDYRIALSARLRDLSREMMSIGLEMGNHGLFNTAIARHGRELFSAGQVTAVWAAEIAASSAPESEAK
jgi:hypothetical protein